MNVKILMVIHHIGSLQIVAFYEAIISFSAPKFQLCQRFNVSEGSRQRSENEIIRRVNENRGEIKLLKINFQILCFACEHQR